MGLETYTGIWSYNLTWPAGPTDRVQTVDDHIRGIKASLRTHTFPNVNGTVTATESELNFCVGVTSAIQAQLNAKAPLASPTFAGTATFNAVSVTGAATFATSPTAPTPTAGDSSTKVATTAFVAATAFSASLPAQSAGVARYVLATDGSSAGWSPRTGEWLYLSDNFI